MGYHLSVQQFNSPALEAIENNKTYSSQIPDVVLVKKVYPRRRKNKSRNWKLRRMGREESEMAPRKQDEAREEQDYEMFLRDVEEDEELRNQIHVFRAQQREQAKRREALQEGDAMEVEGHGEEVGEDDGSDEDDEQLRIPLEQLRLDEEGEEV